MNLPTRALFATRILGIPCWLVHVTLCFARLQGSESQAHYGL